MNFIKDMLAAFSRDESGAVTVDFVILSAAVITIAGVGVTLISDAIDAKVVTL